MNFRTQILLLLSLTVTLASAESSWSSDIVPSYEQFYNEGVNLYRKSQWNEAAEKFRQASQSRTQGLSAKSRYNLGNCHYAAALEQARNGAGADAVTPLIRDAIVSYRSALRLDPNDGDARANLELAVRALDEMNKPEDKKPQKSPQENEQDTQPESQQNQDKQDQSPQQQQQESPESKVEAEPESDAQQQPESDAQQQQESESGESSDQTQGDQPASELADPDSSKETQPNDGGDEPQRQSNQDDGAQQSSDENESASKPETSDQDAAENAKTDSRGKLEATNEQPDETARQGIDAAKATDEDDGKLMTQQEAMKMLQAIRDRDLLRRYQHERSERSRYVPVERDW